MDSSIVLTLHHHVAAQSRYRSGIAREFFEAWLKYPAIFRRDSRPALMRQPHFHPGQHA
jgi:hypothetical protein